ncbi:MAG: hypothetical protein EOP83_10705 [Verrucomicrobiaceae bacterium]|nr:MAG: hypothetical protein EOP83_10705 [Verrucomicrobiaceae bacterium]
MTLAFAASSWMGAVVYVKSYPAIIEYLEPLTFKDTQGDVVTSVHPGRSVVMHVPVRRQPWKCWGSYTYIISGDEATYQFPVFRSHSLTNQVQIHQIRHLMPIPADIPSGRYHWSVVVYPTCEGVDLQPTTIDLHTDFYILD